VGPTAKLDDVEKIKYLTLPRLEIRPIFVQPVASRYYLYRLRYLGSKSRGTVRFQILAAVVMKSSLFQDVTSRIPTFQLAYFFACCLLHTGFLHRSFYRSKDGGGMFLRNVG
jgi:hypothetical protein